VIVTVLVPPLAVTVPAELLTVDWEAEVAPAVTLNAALVAVGTPAALACRV
jgi:hypothetical protein